MQREAAIARHHHADFEEFRADGHGALAVAVREIAAGHREQNERKREQCADDRHQQIALLLREIHGDHDVDDEEFQRVVVEGALELRGDQAPEAALASRAAAGRDAPARLRQAHSGALRNRDWR